MGGGSRGRWDPGIAGLKGWLLELEAGKGVQAMVPALRYLGSVCGRARGIFPGASPRRTHPRRGNPGCCARVAAEPAPGEYPLARPPRSPLPLLEVPSAGPLPLLFFAVLGEREGRDPVKPGLQPQIPGATCLDPS